MIPFGISGLPDDVQDEATFLDSLVERGHSAYELSFVNGFPWKVRQCERFGALAAERGVALSIHAPYFAVLTLDDEEKRARSLAALEHTMKLGKALGAHTVVAHAGHVGGRTAEELHLLVDEGLGRIAPKVRTLGVALGLETSGSDRAFGSLGDIALISERFAFVRPVIDWAHVHAMSGGALTTREAFLSVIAFLRSEFPGWAINPLHTQFTDNEFGPAGEIRHIRYGEGSLRAGPLGEAAVEAGLRMIVISEARDPESHAAILADLRSGESEAHPRGPGSGRPVGSPEIEYPVRLLVEEDGDAFLTVGLDRQVRLSNVDKPFFPEDDYRKGDLLAYYASMAPVLLPHLANRALSLSRYPDGIDGQTFYEKQCPSHAPPWISTAPIHSSGRGEPIDFCTVADLESLLWVVNLGCVEMHPWLSRVQTPELPDFAVFDLDPQEGATWEQVVYVARLVNIALERLGLAAYPKTSGSSGMHIYVPLEPRHEYVRVRRFVETIGRMLEGADPDTVSMTWHKPDRGPRIFIDHNQTVAGKTIASVYSVRPEPGAPVSTPLTWDEVGSVVPGDFTIETVWPRLGRYGDLFAPVLIGGQGLEGAEGALGLS